LFDAILSRLKTCLESRALSRSLFYFSCCLFIVVAYLMMHFGYDAKDDVVDIEYFLKSSFLDNFFTPLIYDTGLQYLHIFRPLGCVLFWCLFQIGQYHWGIIRLSQFLTFMALIYVYVKYMKTLKVSSTSLYIGAFCLISSPFTFALWWKSGYLGGTIVAILFFISLLIIEKDIWKKKDYTWIAGICIVAPYLIEYGLILVALFCVVFFLRKNYIVPCLLCNAPS
jgi:hypothetical protein